MPEKPGVYVFLDNRERVLYVGKAKDLKARVSSYFTGSITLGTKTAALVTQIDKIRITEVESEIESLLLEAFYIKKYKPRYNVRMVDSKSYPLIRITIKDIYPTVMLARKADDPSSLYFGPYPNSGAVKLVLKTIRRAFPYQSAVNHPKRVCLYHHLGLCPCPSVFHSPILEKEYKGNIKNVVRILEGKSRVIIKELEKKRDRASKDEQYEKAKIVQKKIAALSIITQQFHRPFEYHVNPNLRSDLRVHEIEELRMILQDNGLSTEFLGKIECYDISNISGKMATGSLVVFLNGEKTSHLYRRFKIRKDGIPNDFAMIKEVIRRRIKHNEWPIPNLIIVDGGKGQVSSAKEVLSEYNVPTPLIGLAKRDETIVIPFSNPNEGLGFKEVLLPKNTKALHLIMRIRDEAHRFAVTYHRLLRSKAISD